MLPKPHGTRLPLLVTGSSGQSPDWIAQNGDGWMTYPRPGQAQSRVLQDWRNRLEALGQPGKPVLQPLYVDLSDDPDEGAHHIHLGVRAGARSAGSSGCIERQQAPPPPRVLVLGSAAAAAGEAPATEGARPSVGWRARRRAARRRGAVAAAAAWLPTWHAVRLRVTQGTPSRWHVGSSGDQPPVTGGCF